MLAPSSRTDRAHSRAAFAVVLPAPAMLAGNVVERQAARSHAVAPEVPPFAPAPRGFGRRAFAGTQLGVVVPRRCVVAVPAATPVGQADSDGPRDRGHDPGL